MKIKALKVEPMEKAKLVEIENDLEGLREAIGCDYIQVIYPFDDPVAIICDDEGKLKASMLNRLLADENGEVYDVLVGNFLVVGLCEDDFCDLTPELIEKYTEYYKFPQYFMCGDGDMIIVIDENGLRKVI